MSFLRKLVSFLKPSEQEYLEAMIEMANESERCYRHMISDYSMDYLERRNLPDVCPTGGGLFKVRLFGALFMWRAYALSNHRKQKVSEMMNVVTEVAIEPLLYDSSIQFSRDEAKTIASSYLPSTVEAMEAAYRAGPLIPFLVSKEHERLADHLHEAIADSIGEEKYTLEVRRWYETNVLGNVSAAMSHANTWICR